MEEILGALVLILLLGLVNWGLYKYRKSLKVEEGPFYSLFDSNGELVVLTRYRGKTPAHLKKREIGFVESLLNTEDMFQKQAELKGFETAEAYLSHLKGVSEESLIQEGTGLSKEAYYAQKQDMTLEEYRAVKSGTPIEEVRAKEYVGKTIEEAKIVCQHCSSEINKNNTFCSNCGQKIFVQDETMDQSFCVQCGKEIKRNAKFCTNCGHKKS